jgi:hypothetical protein
LPSATTEKIKISYFSLFQVCDFHFSNGRLHHQSSRSGGGGYGIGTGHVGGTSSSHLILNGSSRSLTARKAHHTGYDHDGYDGAPPALHQQGHMEMNGTSNAPNGNGMNGDTKGPGMAAWVTERLPAFVAGKVNMVMLRGKIFI